MAETLAQLSYARVFTKIDIQQDFHKLCISVELEDLTTIITYFGAYKLKVFTIQTDGKTNFVAKIYKQYPIRVSELILLDVSRQYFDIQLQSAKVQEVSMQSAS